MERPPIPRQEYERRLAARRATLTHLVARDAVLAWSRLAAFAGGIVVSWLAAVDRVASPFWLLVPVAAFLSLVVVHERLVRAMTRAARAVGFYELGLLRMADGWVGRGESGERFGDASHPNAEDLDLFGRGSLYELLCIARTAVGEETLARWLKEPASPAEVTGRQEALRELRDRLDLREDLSLIGPEVRATVSESRLVGWAEAPAMPWPSFAVPAALALAAVTLVAAVTWAAEASGRLPFLTCALAEMGLYAMLRRQVSAVLGTIEEPSRELVVVSEALARLELERFASPWLASRLACLGSGGQLASRRISELGRLLALLDSRRNVFFAPLAWVVMWTPLLAHAIDAWRVRNGGAVVAWLAALGEMEALASLAGHAYENPERPFPELVDGPAAFVAEGLGHPLIAAASRVENDVDLGNPVRVLVVSGSNMSGKSTLLRTVGINAVLAMAGAPVCARRLVLSPLAVGGTLHVQDSLLAGRSRFYAEITRLKLLVDIAGASAETARPLLFLLDEILHGTNSHDRRIGAAAVVRGLLERGAIGLVSTHDLALAEIGDELAPRAVNVHFEDRLVDGEMRFDYRIRPGVVEHSNAIALMRSVGLDV